MIRCTLLIVLILMMVLSQGYCIPSKDMLRMDRMAKGTARETLRRKRKAGFKRIPEAVMRRGRLPKEQSFGFRNFEFPFKGRTVKSTDPAFPFLKGAILDRFKKR